MDFDRIGWFVAGLITGAFLDRVTTIILLIAWTVVVNKQLPDTLGAYYPQEILFRTLNYFLFFVTMPITRFRGQKTLTLDKVTEKNDDIPLVTPKLIFPRINIINKPE